LQCDVHGHGAPIPSITEPSCFFASPLAVTIRGFEAVGRYHD